jgi:hypothetical protein
MNAKRITLQSLMRRRENAAECFVPPIGGMRRVSAQFADTSDLHSKGLSGS